MQCTNPYPSTFNSASQILISKKNSAFQKKVASSLQL